MAENTTMERYVTTMPLGSLFKGDKRICVTVMYDDEAVLRLLPTWQDATQIQKHNKLHSRMGIDDEIGAAAAMLGVDDFTAKHPDVSRWLQRYGTPYSSTPAQEAININDPSETSNHYVAKEVEVSKVIASIIQGGVDKGLFTPNAARVYSILSSIPPPFLVPYGTLAIFAGMTGASRAIGTMMRNNPFPILIPCHRVIPAGIVPRLVPVGMVIRGTWSLTYIIGDPDGDNRDNSKGADLPDESFGGYFPGAEMKRFLIDSRV